MKNCLLTKLKSAVDNDNLPYYGGLVLALTGSIDSAFNVSAIDNSSIELRSKGDVLLNSGSEPITIGDSSRTVSISGTSGNFVILNLYDLKTLGIGSLNLSGDISDICYAYSIQDLRLHSNKVKGDLKQILNNMALNRHSGQLAISACYTLKNVPTGIGKDYASRGIVYFTSDTTTYPNGWYVKASNGTYYDSNGNVIEV